MITKTALIIDDDWPMLEIVKTILEDEGYTAYTAYSGQQGLYIALEQKPAIIILDRHMPTMDGNEVLKKLKCNRETATIPVIMLTGENKIDEVKSSIAFGANAYIIKPFKAKDFARKVEKVLLESAKATHQKS